MFDDIDTSCPDPTECMMHRHRRKGGRNVHLHVTVSPTVKRYLVRQARTKRATVGAIVRHILNQEAKRYGEEISDS